MNHTAPLGNPADTAGFTADFKLERNFLDFGIRRHNPFARVQAIVSKPRHERGNTSLNRRNIQRLTDYARGSHDDVGCRNAQRFAQKRAGFFRDFYTVCVAGIRVAAIAHDCARVTVRNIVFRHDKRRAFYEILRIRSRRTRLRFTDDQRKIALGFIFTDTAMYPVCRKAFCGAYAALNFF